MNRILITGASGFIGSHLVERALSEGHEVYAAVRSRSSRDYLQDERIRFVTLRFNDEKADEAVFCELVKKGIVFDAVIHAAGATKARRPEDFYRINTEGTVGLAKGLIRSSALKPNGRFVYFSSLSVYGPAAEKTMGAITEDMQPCPDTHYGRSKLMAERGLAALRELNVVVLRPTGVYGPRERDYLMMAQSIRRGVDFSVGYKPQVLTFIYVDDLVNAAFLALTKGQRGRAYFLTDGAAYSSRTFSDLLQAELGKKYVLHIKAPLWVLRVVSFTAERLARLRGKSSTLNSDKYHIMSQRNWQADILPARRELGFEPQWPLERGVKTTVAWYRRKGWL